MAPTRSKRIPSSEVSLPKCEHKIPADSWMAAAIDFERLHLQQPPFLPRLRDPTDTRYFDDNIDPNPLPPPNGPLPDTPADPLLRDREHGRRLLEIRKELAFKGYTFRGPRREVFDPRIGIVNAAGGKGHLAMFEVENRGVRGPRDSLQPGEGDCRIRSMSM